MSSTPPEVMEYFNSSFKNVIEYREKNNLNRNDVAQTLMQARKELVLNNSSYPEGKEIMFIIHTIVQYFV